MKYLTPILNTIKVDNSVYIHTFILLFSVTRRNELCRVGRRGIGSSNARRRGLTLSHLYDSGLTSFMHEMTTGQRFMSLARHGEEDFE